VAPKQGKAANRQSSALLVLALRRRTSEMSEGSTSRICYVSLSALSGIFCRVGDDLLPSPEALELPFLRANCSACPMSLVVGEPVVGIFPPGKPIVVDETLGASEQPFSPTTPVCLAR
jgi:hypothetical protein